MVKRIIIMLILVGVGVGIIFGLQIYLITELTIEALALADNIVNQTP